MPSFAIDSKAEFEVVKVIDVEWFIYLPKIFLKELMEIISFMFTSIQVSVYCEMHSSCNTMYVYSVMYWSLLYSLIYLKVIDIFLVIYVNMNLSKIIYQT